MEKGNLAPWVRHPFVLAKGSGRVAEILLPRGRMSFLTIRDMALNLYADQLRVRFNEQGWILMDRKYQAHKEEMHNKD